MVGKAVRDKFRKKLTLWIAQQGRCWLCGETMPKPIIGAPGGVSDPEYPTMDHIVPASQGGDRSYANIALAHLRCNQARANRAQVRAIRQA
jgi:5-methylcytosine-specific restriction endonuclease McrA